ncbi:MAG: phosphate ABC transporter substrate-binding protein, partial [Oscillatoriales cyanobacterium RM1_1_9]|nr:phosphate ABC transporter substrate-binding protein [Oscillatoriales cyanobacterium RM1_1_9]
MGWQIYQTLQDQTNSVASNPENCPTQAVPATAKGAKSDECFAGIDVPSGNVLHGGSTTWAPIRERVNPQIEQVHPNYRLTYQQSSNQAPGSGSG